MAPDREARGLVERLVQPPRARGLRAGKGIGAQPANFRDCAREGAACPASVAAATLAATPDSRQDEGTKRIQKQPDLRHARRDRGAGTSGCISSSPVIPATYVGVSGETVKSTCGMTAATPGAPSRLNCSVIAGVCAVTTSAPLLTTRKRSDTRCAASRSSDRGCRLGA